jgi:hypothetical protein
LNQPLHLRFGFGSVAAAAPTPAAPRPTASPAGGIQQLQHQSVALSGAAVVNPNLMRFGVGLGESSAGVPGIVQRQHQSVELGAMSFSVNDAAASYLDVANDEEQIGEFASPDGSADADFQLTEWR